MNHVKVALYGQMLLFDINITWKPPLSSQTLLCRVIKSCLGRVIVDTNNFAYRRSIVLMPGFRGWGTLFLWGPGFCALRGHWVTLPTLEIIKNRHDLQILQSYQGSAKVPYGYSYHFLFVVCFCLFFSFFFFCEVEFLKSANYHCIFPLLHHKAKAYYWKPALGKTVR